MRPTSRIALLVGAGAAAGGLAWYFFGDDEEDGVLGRLRQLVNDGLNALVQKGARLTKCPYDTTTGVVPCAPQDLADAGANGDLELYALARAIASEEGRGSPATQLAVGWAIKNRANASSGSVAALVLHANEPTHSGSFGTQRNIEKGTPGYDGSDRYCSTANDPYDGHLQLGLLIQTGAVSDTTGGAQFFDRPKSDDNPEKVAAKRAAAGLVLADVGADVDSDIRFWRPA